jgi:hypothetical protein
MTQFSFMIALLYFLLLTSIASAVAPSPEVVADYRQRGELDVLQAKLEKMRAAGINQLEPLSFKQSNRTSLNSDTTRLRVLVILADFSDNPASGGQVDDATAADFYDMVFSRDVMPQGSLAEFYLENSYGNLLIEGEVAGWYRMPLTYAEYHSGQYGTQSQQPNAQTLAWDACAAADPDVDFSIYDNDGDGEVEGIFVVHAGPGAEAIPSPPAIPTISGRMPGGLPAAIIVMRVSRSRATQPSRKNPPR